MSAAPSLPSAKPAVAVVLLGDHAHELLQQHLLAIGARIAAAIMATRLLTLLRATRGFVEDDVRAAHIAGLVSARCAELTLRTLALAFEGAHVAVVDVLEARACTDCDDCWAAALDARAHVRCTGCQQRADVDALPVVDDELMVPLDSADDVAPTAPPREDDWGDDVPCRTCHGTGTSAHGGPCGVCAPRPGLARCAAAMNGELLVDVRWS